VNTIETRIPAKKANAEIKGEVIVLKPEVSVTRENAIEDKPDQRIASRFCERRREAKDERDAR
jgi:hypothetical protein